MPGAERLRAFCFRTAAIRSAAEPERRFRHPPDVCQCGYTRQGMAKKTRTRISDGPSRAKRHAGPRRGKAPALPATRRAGDARAGVGPTRPASVVSRRALAGRAARDQAEIVSVPVLADGADPGRTVPSPLAIRDRLVVDRRLVEDYGPDRLFAYDVSTRDMAFLRGLASPGDRIVFRRGGRVAPDRICAVRTRAGVVLARVEFSGHSLVLLPGEGQRDREPIELEDVQGILGVVAGTHVLLIRR